MTKTYSEASPDTQNIVIPGYNTSLPTTDNINRPLSFSDDFLDGKRWCAQTQSD
ncbi:MAG: hypothetical protein MK165_15025 [Pirellulaceae bacterium]|nr:hypothetical protein [Pirellulaceae bacterium]